MGSRVFLRRCGYTIIVCLSLVWCYQAIVRAKVLCLLRADVKLGADCVESCVCTDFEGGRWAIVFLHNHVVPERVLARIVGLKSLFER